MSAGSQGLGLSGAARRELRRLAHPLRPVVQIAGAGLTTTLVDAVDRALEDHELIKLQIVHDRDARRELADEVARRTRSELAGMVGRIAILYRPAADPERRRIDPTARSLSG
jgi:RNA-binding protein